MTMVTVNSQNGHNLSLSSSSLPGSVSCHSET
uniref:Uncharacterized protein n=1 Tax=Arundo donax TaxID=35708 RepID=A0A0A9CKI5_ARUDO